MAEQGYQIGMVGLGVMGRNLLLNMADHGFSGMGYDTDPSKGELLAAEAGERPVKGGARPLDVHGRLEQPARDHDAGAGRAACRRRDSLSPASPAGG